MLTVLMVVGIVLGSGAAAAAQTPSSPLTAAAKRQFEQVHGLVMRAADKVDEDIYAFKPTPEVRSFAGVLGHIADGSVLLCTAAAGQKPEIVRAHEKKTSKVEILAALKESKSFCDGVISKMTDTSGQELVDAFDPNSKTPRLSWIHANTGHVWEHDGNLVTYMRLKSIVPPSSEGR